MEWGGFSHRLTQNFADFFGEGSREGKWAVFLMTDYKDIVDEKGWG
jgi:hypothetical protein